MKISHIFVALLVMTIGGITLFGFAQSAHASSPSVEISISHDSGPPGYPTTKDAVTFIVVADTHEGDEDETVNEVKVYVLITSGIHSATVETCPSSPCEVTHVPWSLDVEIRYWGSAEYENPLKEPGFSTMGTFTVIAAPGDDTMALPFRFNGSPTGTLPVDTTTVLLSLSTHEDATCKYSKIKDLAYTSMSTSNKFSGTNVKFHTKFIAGLTNGSTYDYYVKCINLDGNPNTTDFRISFSIASSAPPPPGEVSISYLPSSPEAGQNVTFTAQASPSSDFLAVNLVKIFIKTRDGSIGSFVSVPGSPKVCDSSPCTTLPMSFSAGKQVQYFAQAGETNDADIDLFIGETSREILIIPGVAPPSTPGEVSISIDPSSPAADESVLFTAEASPNPGRFVNLVHLYVQTRNNSSADFVSVPGSPKQCFSSPCETSMSFDAGKEVQYFARAWESTDDIDQFFIGNSPVETFIIPGTLPPDLLVATYTVDKTNVSVNEKVSFTDTSTGGVTPYTHSWFFGDTKTSDLKNPSHTYNSAGTYTVSLNVKDASGAVVSVASDQKIDIVVSEASGGSFSVEITSKDSSVDTLLPDNPTISPGFSIAFSESHSGDSGGIANRVWTVHLGGVLKVEEYGGVLIYRFTDIGTYIVKLVLTDKGEGAKAEDEVFVTVSNFVGPLLPSYIATTPTTITVGEFVSFKDTTTGGTCCYTYTWFFGDGKNEFNYVPKTISHQYNGIGLFSVGFSVKDGALSEVGVPLVERVLVTVSAAPLAPLVASFTANGIPNPGILNITPRTSVTFLSTVEGGDSPYSYLWDPGEGDSASTKSAYSYTYDVAGSYTATLIVWDDAGSKTEKLFLTVNVGEPSTFSVDIKVEDGDTGVPLSNNPTISPGDKIAFTESHSGGTGSVIRDWIVRYSGEVLVQKSSASLFYTFTEAGSYRVKLILTDGNGKKAEDEVFVTVSGSGIPADLISIDPSGTWNFSNITVGQEGRKDFTITNNEGLIILNISTSTGGISGGFSDNVFQIEKASFSGSSELDLSPLVRMSTGLGSIILAGIITEPEVSGVNIPADTSLTFTIVFKPNEEIGYIGSLEFETTYSLSGASLDSVTLLGSGGEPKPVDEEDEEEESDTGFTVPAIFIPPLYRISDLVADSTDNSLAAGSDGKPLAAEGFSQDTKFVGSVTFKPVGDNAYLVVGGDGDYGDYCRDISFSGIQDAKDSLSLIDYGKFYSDLDSTEKGVIDTELDSHFESAPEGLVTCGRACDDPTTRINEAALCTLGGLLDLPQEIITTLVTIWMPLILAIIFVFSGFLFMTSAGNPTRRQKAIQMVKWAVIGYAIMLSAWVVVSGAVALFGG